MLETVIRKQFKICISHNRIHMYLKAEGLAQEDLKKQKRRKWVFYERKHSLSAGHIDWHEWDGTDVKVCVILDDASRMVLAGGEFTEIKYREQQADNRSTGGQILVALSHEGADTRSWKRVWSPQNPRRWKLEQ